jgi:glyoxylase-like metal-dependent hydrolase (beta-lactamase superfamily II)
MQILDKLYAFCWPDEMGVNNCNTYFIEGPPHVLVDPGHLQFFSHVERNLIDLGYGLSDIDMIICTHVHPDHFESAALFHEHKARLALHELDWVLATSLGSAVQSRRPDLDQWRPDLFLQSGPIDLGGQAWQVIHTPGHSPGSICLYWEKEKVLISGDVVFNPGIGRTDLPGGDSSQIRASFDLLRKLALRHLLPGHGNLLSGEKEARLNFERIESLYL